MTTWAEIIEAGKYEYYGVRAVCEELAVGDVPANSMRWIDGDPTGEELEGACAIQVRSASDLEAALGSLGSYVGTPVLLGSMYMEYGEDTGEIIMQDAVVLAVA